MKLYCWSWEMLAVIQQFTSAEKPLLKSLWTILKLEISRMHLRMLETCIFQHTDRACAWLGSVVGLFCTGLSTHSTNQPASPPSLSAEVQHGMSCSLLIENLACLIFLPLFQPATLSYKVRFRYFPIWEGCGTLSCPHSYHLCPHSPLYPSHVPCKQKDSRAGRKIPWTGVL